MKISSYVSCASFQVFLRHDSMIAKEVKGLSYRTMGDTLMGSVQFRGELPLTTVPAESELTLCPSFSSYPLSVCFLLLVFNEGEAEGCEETEKLER